MTRSFLLSLGVLIGLVLLQATSASADEAKSSSNSNSGGTASSGCGGQVSSINKIDIERIAQEVHGDKASCYIKLYAAETSENPACNQQAVPNPPGIGICTLEGDPTKRKARGGDCAVDNTALDGSTEDGIKAQMKCCAQIMKDGGNQYFQPVKEGKVPNCETGS